MKNDDISSHAFYFSKILIFWAKKGVKGHKGRGCGLKLQKDKKVAQKQFQKKKKKFTLPHYFPFKK